MRHCLSVVGLIVLLVGASVASDSADGSSWLGASRGDVIRMLGEPLKEKVRRGGGTVLFYEGPPLWISHHGPAVDLGLVNDGQPDAVDTAQAVVTGEAVTERWRFYIDPVDGVYLVKFGREVVLKRKRSPDPH